MKKNKVILSLLAFSIVVSSANAWFIGGKEILQEHPLQLDDRSIENGGTLQSIDSAMDGVGAIIEAGDSIFSINNSAFNDIVYKFGTPAKRNDVSLIDYVTTQETYNPDFITDKDIQNVDVIREDLTNSGLYPEGEPCDDGNFNTINDVYENAACVGTPIEAAACDDYDPNTENDIYINGVCKGTYPDGTSCDNGNENTTNDYYFNGVCIDTVESGEVVMIPEVAKPDCNWATNNWFDDHYHVDGYAWWIGPYDRHNNLTKVYNDLEYRSCFIYGAKLLSTSTSYRFDKYTPTCPDGYNTISREMYEDVKYGWNSYLHTTIKFNFVACVKDCPPNSSLVGNECIAD